MVGPFEVFTFARAEGDQEYPLFEVCTIAEKVELVTSVGGLKVMPDCDFNSAPALDLLVVPGGLGTRTISQSVVDWVAAKYPDLPRLASVCTGALVLAKAGLLDGQTATTHWRLIEQLRESFPKIKVVENLRWVESGNIYSSQGVSAGIDMSLHIVRCMFSLPVAIWTAKLMQYPWISDPAAY